MEDNTKPGFVEKRLKQQKDFERKQTLDILLDALTEKEWQELKYRAELRQALYKNEVPLAKMQSAVQFGDWILKHNVLPSYDEDGAACWIVADGVGKEYTSTQLYWAYMNGDFEPDEDDMSDWDVTLMDGLDDLDS
jgi:hypothetical protein